MLRLWVSLLAISYVADAPSEDSFVADSESGNPIEQSVSSTSPKIGLPESPPIAAFEQSLPLDEIQGPHRDRVLKILQKPIARHRGTPEMFPCHPELLEWLIRHPATVGDYWKELGMDLVEVEPAGEGFVCRDSVGAVVHFNVVCEKPGLRIAYCVGEAPCGILPVKMRAEMVVVHRYKFETYVGAGDYVVQQLDGYATASGVTLKMAMKLAPGQSERMVQSCVEELKVFFSVMCRLMQLRPHWSLEKLPAATARLTDSERTALETILRSLPPTRRSVPIVRTPQGFQVEQTASSPATESR